MPACGMPLDDLRDLLAGIEPPDRGAGAAMEAAFARAGYAGGGLGRLKTLAIWLAETRGRMPPPIGRAGVALYAATHGFEDGRKDALSQQQRRVEAVAAGAAAVSHLCVANDLSLNVYDLALDLPSADIVAAASLDERACAATLAFGMEATAEAGDLLCLGTLGEQADIAAISVLAALAGEAGTPAGAGGRTVRAALSFHAAHLADPLEALRRLGGRDVAALAGAIVAARVQRIPVVLDGLPALAAAAVLDRLKPGAIAHCILAGADTAEALHYSRLLGMEALLALGVGEGGGCGAAVAGGLVKTAAALAGGMAEIAGRG